MSETSSITETVVDSFNDVGTAVSNLNLNSHYKSGKPLPWWFLGPVALAVVMFLLIGTIFERRIETLWRRTVARRQALTSQGTDYVEPQAEPISDPLHVFKTPTDKALASKSDRTGDNTNSETSIIANNIYNLIRIEKSLHCEGETFTSNSSNGIY